MRKIYIIELCNYEDYPTGGHLSFAKQMLNAFGNQVVLVGISTGSEPIGQWIKKEIEGIEYDFFSVRKVYKDFKKPIIPTRLKNFYYLVRYRRELELLKNESVFIQTPEVLFAIRNWGIKNLCFRSPGVANMLVSSRFWYAKYFKSIYESLLFVNLQKVNLILASADMNSIIDFCHRSKNRIHERQIIQFPTRIDTSLFKPVDRTSACKSLNLDARKRIIVTTGRLSYLKGWKFMIDCFELFKVTNADSHFYFLGDGEEKSNIANYINTRNLDGSIFLKGQLDSQTISMFLNASDLYIMGSFVEGWSTSLVEAISCAVPVCVTNFSSSKELVSNNVNGFVCESRNENEFVFKMSQALKISKKVLLEKSLEMNKFSIASLKTDLLKSWIIS